MKACRVFFRIILPLLVIMDLHAQSALDSIKSVDPFDHELIVKAIIKRVFTANAENFMNMISTQEKIVDQLKKGSENKKLIDAWMQLAYLNERASRYNEATANLFEALTIAEATKDSISIGKIKIRIDDLNYVNFGVTVHGKNTAEGVEILAKSEDPGIKAFYHNMRAKLSKDHNSLKYHITQAYSIQKKLVELDPNNKTKLLTLSKYMNGMSAVSDSAEKYLKEAISIATRLDENYFKLFYVNNLGYLYESKADYVRALEQYLYALQLCFEHNIPTLLRNTTSNISRVYRITGDHKKASRYAKLEILAIECSHEELSEVKYDELRVQYELGKKEKLLSTLQDESSELKRSMTLESLQKYILAFGVFILIVVLVHIQVARRKIARVNKEIEEEKNIVSIQKMELEKLNNELVESTETLRQAQAIAGLASWEQRLDDNKISFSDNLPIMFNTSKEELSKNFKEVIAAQVHRNDIHHFNKYLQMDHIKMKKGEVTFRIYTGENLKWINSKFSLIYNPDNTPEKVAHTMQDITLQKLEENNKLKLAAQQSFTKQLLESQEGERRRIAGELHDGLGQEILLLKSKTQLLMKENSINESDKEKLDELCNYADQMLQSVREITFDLSPVHLNRVGLTATLIETIAKIGEVSGINFTSSIDNIDNCFQQSSELSIFRIVQESINNIVKHSHAKNAHVEITRKNKFCNIEISDEGASFNYQLIREKAIGFGLRNIKNRVNLLKGELTINSNKNLGTKIKIRIKVQTNEKQN